MDFTVTIKGHVLEYLDDTHSYICDGIELPSITHILKSRFPHKYSDIPPAVLKRAADKGIAMHDAIEQYFKNGIVSDIPELRNFLFLQRQYKFEVVENELPVILFTEGMFPFAAGRLDMILNMDGKLGVADLKRTSVLDKAYLADQLNLYRIAVKQSYDVDCEFLRGIHLREDTRKFVPIPINEKLAWKIVKEYKEKTDDTESR